MATMDPPLKRPPGPMPHLPALDGLRGIAVVAVLLFHGGCGWASGGFLGVSVFFTLSGFLITNLLVREWESDGRISLRRFWARRARRLLPAALVALAGIALYGATVATPDQLRALRGDLLAALAYVANWRFVAGERSYADLFADPSPVQHFWSLAIEEQVYVVLPIVAVVVLGRLGRRGLAWLFAGGMLASFATAWLLRADFDRVYYGTDTRIGELLAGALLALWWSTQADRFGRTPPRLRRAVVVAGFLGLAGTIAAWPLVGEASPGLARGGLVLQAAATVAILAGITAGGGLATILSWWPLRAIGLVSYGLYLYHWPIFLALDESRTGQSGPTLFAIRMGVTTAATVASYVLIEQPIRRRSVWVVRQWRPALAASAAAVVALGVVVTRDPPPTTLAYAGVRLDQAEATVFTAPAPGTRERRPGAVSGHAADEQPSSPVTSPSTVVILGDSGMRDLAPALAAGLLAAEADRVLDLSWPGFGLTRPHITWRDDWQELVDREEPDLVIVMLGGWDLEWLEHHGTESYAQIVDEAVEVLSARGARLLWLGMLPGGTTADRPAEVVFAALPGRYPGVVRYLDPEPSLAAPDGTYPAILPARSGDPILARKPDEWHLCPDGAVLVATFVFDHLERSGWVPTPAPGWELGSWRDDPTRYDDPRGGCDPSRVPDG